MPRQHSWFALITAIHLCVTAASAQQTIHTPEEMVDEAFAMPSDQEILAALHHAADVHPTHWYVHKQLGQRLLQTGDYEAAIPPLERAVQLGGDYVGDLQAYVAQAYAGLGRTDEALQWLRRSINQGSFALGRQVWQGASEFDAIKSDERFVWLTGLVPAGDHPGRDEAWEYDVRLIHDRLENAYYDLDRVTTSEALRKRFDDLIARIPQLSDEQIVFSVAEILGEPFDGHTQIWHLQPMLQRVVPLVPELFEEGLFVAQATEDHAQWLGWEILSIGGVSAAEATERIGAIIPHDNEFGRRIGPLFLSFGPFLDFLGMASGGSTTVLLRDPASGQERSLDLKADHSIQMRQDRSFGDGWTSIKDQLPPDQVPHHLRHRDQPYWVETVEDGRVVYAQVNMIANAGDESLAQFFEKIIAEADRTSKVEALVLDLRYNGGGNGFLNDAVVAALHRCKLLRQPGKFFVVCGRNTYSAAQNLLTDLDVLLDALIVGEPSASRPNFIGEGTHFNLPYHPEVTVGVSTRYHQHGRDSSDRRVSIAPDLPAPPSIKARLAGIDPALRIIMARLDQLGDTGALAARADLAYGKKQWAEAAAAYKELRTLGVLSGQRNFQFGHALLVERVDLETAIDVFRAAYNLGYGASSAAINLGFTMALLERNDEAIQWLETAFKRGWTDRSILDDSDFDAIRDDPRFKALLEGD